MRHPFLLMRTDNFPPGLDSLFVLPLSVTALYILSEDGDPLKNATGISMLRANA